jgi:hypothetical protein
MPTLEEWEQALAAPRQIYIESSPQLLMEVQERHTRKDETRRSRGQAIPPRKSALSLVPAFQPGRQLRLVPAYLLHRLGVVTTPPIENLTDLCSTWAYLRYLWAFEIPPIGTSDALLRLSREARDIDFHQKGLLSDQIGVAMASLLLGDYLNAPLAADVGVAMDDPAWPIRVQFDSTPDYLFFDPTHTVVFIVECKGTQTSRAAAMEQLRRGTEQVPSLTFTDGRTPPSLVIAMYLSRKGTIVFVLAPPRRTTRI